MGSTVSAATSPCCGRRPATAELSKFRKPTAITAKQDIAVNAQGMCREEVLARLESHGALRSSDEMA